MPHILRSVALIGVDSVMAPRALRLDAWKRLARDLDKARLDSMTTVEPMSKLPQLAEEILDGRICGRVVIDVSA
jgi:alcohol dehydrogenase/acrylyl-CoA reductase (NADPH)